MTTSERSAFTVIGAVALAGLGLLWWQRTVPPLMVQAAPVEAASWDAALEAARRIDVNAATVAEWERLPGVGPKLAQRIVEYRQLHGPFASPEELERVPGIGPKLAESLRDYVTVSER